MDMNWQYAWTKPQVSGDLKTTIQDFYVEEELGFEPEGTGEHLYLFVEKQGINTDYLAKLLANHAGISTKKVTYSGVKDRHAVTRQWFCLHVLNETPDFTGFMEKVSDDLHSHEAIRIIKQARHPRKLKIGIHKKNRFLIRLRRLEGSMDDLKNRLVLVGLQGVPNYFGPQRFGIAGNNLPNGVEWLKKPRSSKRRFSKTESFWVSSVRSWFFNKALSDQVYSGAWNRLFINDRVQLQNETKQLKLDEIDANLLLRLQQVDLHPLMPLANSSALQDTSATRSQSMSQSWSEYLDVLENLINLELSREERATRLYPESMEWDIVDEQLILQFSLPKGAFATSVLRELINVTDCSNMEAHESFNSK